MKSILYYCLLPFCLSLYCSAVEADFYVSPDGNDQNGGTINAPFATLDQARKAVKSLKLKKKGDITVLIRGGHYEVEKTVVFGLDDSKVTQWTKASGKIEGLPQIAQDKVFVAKVDEPFKALFNEDGILQRARSKPFFTVPGNSKDKAVIPKGSYKQYSKPLQAELWIRPHHAWIVNILPIKKFDLDKGVINTSIDATYPMKPLHFLKETPNAWIENAIEELDEEGEWVYDESAGKLYHWPIGKTNVYRSSLNEIIRVEGDIDFDGATDQPVEFVRFSGLTFKHGERYELNKNDAGIQHDWNMLDKPNALVRFRGAENCKLDKCHFLHSGSGAIRVDLHGKKNIITGNHIEHIGGAGISLIGYGPGTKDVNVKNQVTNNHIHHVGEIYWHSPGMMVWQSGENRIANNYIHHTNYTGLIVSGCMLDFFRKFGRELSKTIRKQDIPNEQKIRTDDDARPYLHTHDNLIELNEISHSMQKLGDGNAIYIRGAGPNNLIRRNYVHHLITPMIMQCAIRTDGGQRDTIIRENIIYKCTSQGMMLKLNTKFDNNIIVDVIHPPRGYYLSLREGPLRGASIKNNIFYSTGPVEQFISELGGKRPAGSEDRRGREVARIQDADTAKNIYFSVSDSKETKRFLQELDSRGASNDSLAVDPMFVDIESEDFNLKPESPALKLGFIPIDQSKIGLLK